MSEHIMVELDLTPGGERLPKEGAIVLALVETIYFADYDHGAWADPWDDTMIYGVTHWAEIPVIER